MIFQSQHVAKVFHSFLIPQQLGNYNAIFVNEQHITYYFKNKCYGTSVRQVPIIFHVEKAKTKVLVTVE